MRGGGLGVRNWADGWGHGHIAWDENQSSAYAIAWVDWKHGKGRAAHGRTGSWASGRDGRIVGVAVRRSWERFQNRVIWDVTCGGGVELVGWGLDGVFEEVEKAGLRAAVAASVASVGSGEGSDESLGEDRLISLEKAGGGELEAVLEIVRSGEVGEVWGCGGVRFYDR